MIILVKIVIAVTLFVVDSPVGSQNRSCGAGEGIRTLDSLLGKQILYR